MVVTVLFTVTSCTRIEPGHVGIKLNLAGSDKGVENTPLQTGWVFYNIFTQKVYEYPTFVQTAVWTANPNEGRAANEEITFTTGDQMQVKADISLAYRLRSDRVPTFYTTFRSDDLAEFTHGYLRNLAREKFDNAAGKYRIEQIMGDNGPFLAEVRKALQDQVSDLGVELMQFGFIGAPRPPEAVIEAINSKVKATQDAIRVENEVRQAKAEADKVAANADGERRAAISRAEGQAVANERLARSLTPSLMEWRRLQIQEAAIDKWQGQVPQVQAGQNSGFLFQLPKP